MIKINWNLKDPIKLSRDLDNTEEENSDSNSSISSGSNHNNFKATSLKDLNQKKQQQTSWDDLSCGRASDSEKTGDNALFRFQTVRCKATSRWKRSPIHPMVNQLKEEESKEDVNYF